MVYWNSDSLILDDLSGIPLCSDSNCRPRVHTAEMKILLENGVPATGIPRIPHSEKIISFTKVALPYGWLGNMSPFPVQHEGVWWKTTEHLFQALRFPSGSLIRHGIRDQPSPMGAKMRAKRHKAERAVEPLSEVDLDNMRFCLFLKARTHRKIREWLLATKMKHLIEDVSARPRKNDPCGMCLEQGVWVGQNLLGNLWMQLRFELAAPDHK